MNEFIHLVFGELRGALGLAVAAVGICAVILAAVYAGFQKKYQKKRRFPWKKAILILVLLGYTMIVFYATILRGNGYGARTVNLHLFRAWREAWNSFSVKNWLNVLLNVGMFVPLGMLLPLLFRRMKRWYCTLAAGFGMSLLIEIIQYLLSRGLFDVDDLFANTLGAMLGYCVVMLLYVIFNGSRERKWAALRYAIIPVVTAVAISGIFVVYRFQEYGNLPTAAAYRTNTKGIEWILLADLKNCSQTAPVYRAETYDKEACDSFGQAFFEHLGVELQDIRYYDEETWFANHNSPGHFLSVSRLDRSYSYHTVDMENQVWAETKEGALRELLLDYGIRVPLEAEFSYLGDGMHQFVVKQLVEGRTMTDGILQCRYREQGGLQEINHNLVTYEFYKEAPVISMEEAYQRLCRGDFTDNLALYKPKQLKVLSCELQYMIDTKGFYQPVYFFAVTDETGEYERDIMIPALRR